MLFVPLRRGEILKGVLLFYNFNNSIKYLLLKWNLLCFVLIRSMLFLALISFICVYCVSFALMKGSLVHALIDVYALACAYYLEFMTMALDYGASNDVILI